MATVNTIQEEHKSVELQSTPSSIIKIALFDCKIFNNVFQKHEILNETEIDIEYLEFPLSNNTAKYAEGCSAVICFNVNNINSDTFHILSNMKIKTLIFCSPQYNHINVETADKLGITIQHIPHLYPAEGIAEYAVGLLLTLNRHINRAYLRARELNFELHGLVGSVLKGKTVGVIGTGKIGSAFARIMLGFGCNVIGYDEKIDEELVGLGVKYVTPLTNLYQNSDIISLHLPINHSTYHLINQDAFMLMKSNVLIINTSNGNVIERQALLENIKNRKIGGIAMDVYSREKGVFYHNCSDEILNDDVLLCLLSYSNVLVTPHCGFLTHECLNLIKQTSYNNVYDVMVNGNKMKSAQNSINLSN